MRFHPHKCPFMLAGSEDGLMCFFETVSIEEDVLAGSCRYVLQALFFSFRCGGFTFVAIRN